MERQNSKKVATIAHTCHDLSHRKQNHLILGTLKATLLPMLGSSSPGKLVLSEFVVTVSYWYLLTHCFSKLNHLYQRSPTSPFVIDAVYLMTAATEEVYVYSWCPLVNLGRNKLILEDDWGFFLL